MQDAPHQLLSRVLHVLEVTSLQDEIQFIHSTFPDGKKTAVGPNGNTVPLNAEGIPLDSDGKPMVMGSDGKFSNAPKGLISFAAL